MTEKPKTKPAGPPPAQPPPSNPEAPPAQAPPPPEDGSDLIATPKGYDLAPMGDRGVVFRTFEELRRFAKMVVDAGAAPKGMTAGAATVAMVAGMDRGLGPLGGLQSCTIINGNLSWTAQGALALIRNSPVCKRGTLRAWVEGKGDQRKGVAVAHRIGYKEPSRAEFSWSDAKQAKLTTKDNWVKYPDRQLKARAIGFLARDDYSDVLAGFPLAEEAEDFDNRPPAEALVSSAVVVSSPTPPPRGAPDPVLEALEAAAPPVIVEPPPEPPAAEEKNNEGGGSLRAKLGILGDVSEASPNEYINAARATVSSEYEGMHPEASQNGDVTASEEGPDPKGPPAALEGQEEPGAAEDGEITPPRGVTPITEAEADQAGGDKETRRAHLEADAELVAAEEQTTLFDGEGEVS